MEWKPDYNIGNQTIDSHHKALFDIFGRLNKMAAQNADMQTIKRLLLLLKDFFAFHSDCEEELLSQIGYPQTSAHLKLHQALAQSIEKGLEQMETEPNFQLSKLTSFLANWFNKHVATEDIKFRAHINTHPVHGLERNFFLELEEKETIEKIKKLRLLFERKLINSEDFKEQKIKLIEHFFARIGVCQIAVILNLLNSFQENKLISSKEANTCLTNFLGQIDINQGLEEIGEIEGQLHYLQALVKVEMIDEDRYEELKIEIFQAMFA